MTQPRLTSPRSVNTAPESLSTSRRGSGRWRSSSASGLSMFQLAGSADSENYGGKLGVVRARLDGGSRWVRRTLSTSDLVDPSYRESSWEAGERHPEEVKQVGGEGVTGGGSSGGGGRSYLCSEARI